jgi:hypothetical protein
VVSIDDLCSNDVKEMKNNQSTAYLKDDEVEASVFDGLLGSGAAPESSQRRAALRDRLHLHLPK